MLINECVFLRMLTFTTRRTSVNVDLCENTIQYRYFTRIIHNKLPHKSQLHIKTSHKLSTKHCLHTTLNREVVPLNINCQITNA